VWLLIVVPALVVVGVWWIRRLLTNVFDKMHGGQ
jgi:flagellar biogenesis protein FliO